MTDAPKEDKVKEFAESVKRFAAAAETFAMMVVKLEKALERAAPVKTAPKRSRVPSTADTNRKYPPRR